MQSDWPWSLFAFWHSLYYNRIIPRNQKQEKKQKEIKQ